MRIMYRHSRSSACNLCVKDCYTAGGGSEHPDRIVEISVEWCGEFEKDE